jgi:hypothetical protein
MSSDKEFDKLLRLVNSTEEAERKAKKELNEMKKKKEKRTNITANQVKELEDKLTTTVDQFDFNMLVKQIELYDHRLGNLRADYKNAMGAVSLRWKSYAFEITGDTDEKERRKTRMQIIAEFDGKAENVHVELIEGQVVQAVPSVVGESHFTQAVEFLPFDQ